MAADYPSASRKDASPKKGEGWTTRHESFLRETRYSLFLFSRSFLSMAGLILILAFVVIAIIGPIIATYHPSYPGGNELWPSDPASTRLPPSSEHYFGTDQQGIDVYSMVLYGARKSLFICLIVVIPAALIGIALGGVAGYYGGTLGEIIMRLTDVFLAVPSLVLAMAITAALGASILHITYAMIVTWWPWYTRLVYGQVVSLREKQFVEAARSVGASHPRILYKHVLKNSWSPVIVQATSDFGYVLLAAAALGWLGLGAPRGTAEWGIMISVNQDFILQAWWGVVFPGLAIVISVLGFNLLGDGLRDVLDPKMRR